MPSFFTSVERGEHPLFREKARSPLNITLVANGGELPTIQGGAPSPLYARMCACSNLGAVKVSCHQSRPTTMMSAMVVVLAGGWCWSTATSHTVRRVL